LTALQPAPGSELQGRVSWRLHTDDRLPMAGPVPEWALGAGGAGSCAQPVRQDLARRWPRVPGLFVLTALGARGATLAPLLGRLVAAQATGAPWPLEQDLADAVDPVRWALRAARAAQARAAD
jgi:tRNA 5-methylaminomethyl-2-thiouridine biosynthesis bifunctional protein